MYNEYILSGLKENVEADAETYVNFINMREPLILRLSEIKTLINEIPNQAKENLQAVIKKEAEYQKTAVKLMDSVKDSIKQINLGKKINNAYLHNS